MFQEGDDGRGFEEVGDVGGAAGAVGGFVQSVALVEVGASNLGGRGVGEDGEEVGPGSEGLLVG